MVGRLFVATAGVDYVVLGGTPLLRGDPHPVSSLAAASMGWVNTQSPAKLVECLLRVGSLFGSELPTAGDKGY